MFEKEAEKYYETETAMIENITGLDFQNGITKAFQDGAEFGYNKAKIADLKQKLAKSVYLMRELMINIDTPAYGYAKSQANKFIEEIGK